MSWQCDCFSVEREVAQRGGCFISTKGQRRADAGGMSSLPGGGEEEEAKSIVCKLSHHGGRYVPTH